MANVLDALPRGLALWSGWLEYVVPTAATRITAVLQQEFRPQRLLMAPMMAPIGTPPREFVIHDLLIGGKSLASPIYADQVVGKDLVLPTVQVGQALQLDVEYIGPGEGAPFRGVFVGAASVGGSNPGVTVPMISPHVTKAEPAYHCTVFELDGTRYVLKRETSTTSSRLITLLKRETSTTSSRLITLHADPPDVAPPDHARVLREHVFAEPRMVSLSILDDKVWQGHDERHGNLVFMVDVGSGRVLCAPDGLNAFETMVGTAAV